jgi:hypothetical protein
MHSSFFKFILVLNSAFLTSDLRVRGQNTRDFSLFCSSSKNCPSAGCTSAVNVVYKNADVFETKTVSLNHIL